MFRALPMLSASTFRTAKILAIVVSSFGDGVSAVTRRCRGDNARHRMQPHWQRHKKVRHGVKSTHVRLHQLGVVKRPRLNRRSGKKSKARSAPSATRVRPSAVPRGGGALRTAPPVGSVSVLSQTASTSRFDCSKPLRMLRDRGAPTSRPTNPAPIPRVRCRRSRPVAWRAEGGCGRRTPEPDARAAFIESREKVPFRHLS